LSEIQPTEEKLKTTKIESLASLESDHIVPLLAALRFVAKRFDLLSEVCQRSEIREVHGMAEPLGMAGKMVDDLLEEALETSLRRAVEDHAWADPQPLGEEEDE
jgi:hypothetical protein